MTIRLIISRTAILLFGISAIALKELHIVEDKIISMNELSGLSFFMC